MRPNATGSSGGLTVTGTGTAGTGGTIQNTTGVGIQLTSTEDVSLSYMNVLSSGDDGIRGQGVDDFELIEHEVKVTVDWSIREQGRAKVRSIVKRLLAKHGYPPDKQEAAIDFAWRPLPVVRPWPHCGIALPTGRRCGRTPRLMPPVP